MPLNRIFDSVLGQDLEALLEHMRARGLSSAEELRLRALVRRIEVEEAAISIAFAVVSALGMKRFREVTVSERLAVIIEDPPERVIPPVPREPVDESG